MARFGTGGLSKISDLFSGPLRLAHGDHVIPEWKPVAWLYSLILPLGLYVFEAARVITYPSMQAPNVSLAVQLILMFLFFAVWVLAPRTVWIFASRMMRRGASHWKTILLTLAAAGFVLSLGHMLLGLYFTTIIKPVNGWDLSDYSSAYGRLWLGCVGNWFVLYSLSVGVFLLLFALANRDKAGAFKAAPAADGEAEMTRYEIRQNGKTLSIPFSDIIWVNATGDYVEFHTVSGILMARKSLSRLAEEIGKAGFIKSHRSALVNAAHVVSVKSSSNGSAYTVQLSYGEEAPLARRKLSSFKKSLRFATGRDQNFQ